MSDKREGPILAMAIFTIFLIIIMAAVSGMTLYTALYPPDFEKRAREVEQQRTQAGDANTAVEPGPAESTAPPQASGDETGS